MNDGDLVTVALARRAQKNQKLREALGKMLCSEAMAAAVAKYAHVPTRDLVAEAQKVRAKERREFNERIAKYAATETPA